MSSPSFTNPARGSRHERGYGAAWERVREQVMRRDAGLCQPCLKRGRHVFAKAVDHIVNRAAGGSDDPANLQAICTPCHADKTAAEALAARGATPRLAPAACNADGLPTSARHPWNREGGIESLARNGAGPILYGRSHRREIQGGGG